MQTGRAKKTNIYRVKNNHFFPADESQTPGLHREEQKRNKNNKSATTITNKENERRK